MHAGEEVFGPFVVSRGDGSIMFDFVEEALDEISATIQVETEGRRVFTVRHGLDVGPCAALVEALPQRVAVIGAVGEKDLPLDQGVEHAGCAATIVRLALGQFQRDRLPSASTSAWIFVVSPPRERPMQQDRSSFLALAAC